MGGFGGVKKKGPGENPGRISLSVVFAVESKIHYKNYMAGYYIVTVATAVVGTPACPVSSLIIFRRKYIFCPTGGVPNFAM